MSNSSNEEKTEHPTAYRLKQAKKKGNNQYSRELYSFFILIITLLNLFLNGQLITFYLQNIIKISFDFDDSLINNNYLLQVNSVHIITNNVFYILEIIFIPMLVTSIVLMICSSKRCNFTFLFNFNRINPVQGFKKLFSFQSSINLLKTIIKILLMSTVLFYLISKNFLNIFYFMNLNFKTAIYSSVYVIFKFLLIILITLLPIVIFDVCLEKFNFYKKLRMTRKEIRDELKNMEGDPYIKNRIRQIMRSNKRRNMLKNVSRSDVIIVNPIHYAVALQYNEKKMSAPKVLAKGKGLLALQIQKIGKNYSIPIFSSAILAKILYNHINLGQCIPNELYEVIAEVLAWVWKIKKWKKVGGIFPKSPENFFIHSKLHAYKNGINK